MIFLSQYHSTDYIINSKIKSATAVQFPIKYTKNIC